MEEKLRKKEVEKHREQLEDHREEQRLRGEQIMRTEGENHNQTGDFGNYKGGMPAAPVVNKTLYNNHHQVNIVGSHTSKGQDFMRSQTQYNQSSGNVMNTPPVNQ